MRQKCFANIGRFVSVELDQIKTAKAYDIFNGARPKTPTVFTKGGMPQIICRAFSGVICLALGAKIKPRASAPSSMAFEAS